MLSWASLAILSFFWLLFWNLLFCYIVIFQLFMLVLFVVFFVILFYFLLLFFISSVDVRLLLFFVCFTIFLLLVLIFFIHIFYGYSSLIVTHFSGYSLHCWCYIRLLDLTMDGVSEAVVYILRSYFSCCWCIWYW